MIFLKKGNAFCIGKFYETGCIAERIWSIFAKNLCWLHGTIVFRKLATYAVQPCFGWPSSFVGANLKRLFQIVTDCIFFLGFFSNFSHSIRPQAIV